MFRSEIPLGDHKSARPASPGRPGLSCRLLAVTVLLAVPQQAWGTATLTIPVLPAGIMADSATEAAVFCSITNGYPHNLYGIKGTFSPGDLPYYGLTFNPQTTMWASQTDAWSKAQPKVQTDAYGDWSGYLVVRLERAAPCGDMRFRFSAIPLSPISNPGPTVSDWHPLYALDPDATGGWLRGHVYRDAACTVPAKSVVVQAEDAFGRILGAYLSQDARVIDGEDRDDSGLIVLGVPKGRVFTLTGRSRGSAADGPAGTLVPVFTKSRPPWRVGAGETFRLDDPPWGDADGDGALTAADAVLAARLAGGLAEPGPDGPRADVWPALPDGLITPEDALFLLRRALGTE